MNKIFRTIWNHARQSFVVVGETAKSHTKAKASRVAGVILAAGSFLLVSATAFAVDLPTGGQIVGGSGSIATNGNTMTITQDTARMAADWQSFSIGAGNTVNFVQPSASSVALNRVLGSDVSVIQGALRANGQVFLLNPNGVLFTPSAQVNVGGIVASTLNMSTADFMAGNYKFEGTSSNAIINQGNITAVGDGNGGGTIALIAAKITNTGSLTANKGNVLLGAGSKVTLDLGGPVKLQVTQGQIDALIESGGAIKADGGVVLLTAKAAGDLAISVINHTGVIEAQTLATGEKGQITLLGEGELITVSGKLDASAPNGGVGGRIVAIGTRVLIDDGAHLTASGKNGGGEVLVGGSYQNEDASVYQATGTIVAPTAKLEANAIDNGNGGTVVAWSDITKEDSVTRAYGTFEAKGGANGGDGGRIETSGAFLDIAGATVNTSAPFGKTGEWLLDPNNITICNACTNPTGVTFNYTSDPDITVNSAYLQNNLANTNVTVQTYSGDITLNNAITWSAGTTFKLNAGGSIILNASITGSSLSSTAWLQYNAFGSPYNKTISSSNGSGTVQAGTIILDSSWSSNTTALSTNVAFTPLVELRSQQANFTFTPNNFVTGKINTDNMTLNVKWNTVLQNAHISGSGMVISENVAGHGTPSIGGLSGTGTVNLNGWNLHIKNNLGGTYTGQIYGSNSIYIDNGGNQTFSQNSMVDWSGNLYINAGGKIYFDGAFTRPTYIQGGTLLMSGDSTFSNVLSMSSGDLWLQSGNLNASNLSASGGTINTGSRILTLNGIASPTIGAVLEGSGALVLTPTSGNPVYTFNGNSTGYTGNVTVNSGAIAHIGNGNALGTSGAIIVNSGATLRVGSGVATHSSKSLTLNGSGVGGQNGALSVSSGTGTFGGAITLGSATTIGTSSTGNLTIGGTINGAYALTVNSSNTVTFNGAINSIASLTTNAGGSTVINANLTTTGAQTYNDAASVTGARTLISNNGQINFTGGATSNNNNLILQSAGTDLALTGTVATGTGWLTLRKASGTTGTLSSTGTLSGSGLLVQNFATANLNLASGHNFATIAANGIGTAFNYVDADALTIGTVNSVNGLALGSATASVATKTGNLTISQNIATTNATAAALILNAGSDAAVGTSTGGDIVRSGTPTISVGAAGTAKLYTGSIVGSTGWAGTTLVSASGRFRYNSDESSTGYSKALSTGLNLIYREQPTISATVSSASKTYDGLAYSGTPTLSYTLQNGDTAGADITIGTSVITGDTTATNAGSYSIGANLSGFSNTLGYANPVAATAGTLIINQRLLSFTGTRVYDATTDVAGSALTLGNLVSGEDLSLSGTGAVANKNVGDGKTVTLGSLALANGTNGLASNYTLSGGTYTVNITKADISSVAGITANNREYDQSTVASLNYASGLTFNGIQGSDNLTVAAATGAFEDKNAANGKTVNISGITLSGTDVGNYNLVSNTATTTANITPKELSLTGLTVANKVYDRTTAATISNAGSLTGLISGDAVTADASSATASFADWNVGTAKPITVSGINITGGDAGNYTLAALGAGVTANITAKSLSLELTGTATRVYDSSTDIGFTGYTVEATGVISGDTVDVATGSLTGFVDKNVGTNKAVTFIGFGLSGDNAGNYQLVSGSANANASITAATISTVTGITAANKVYDATTAATLTTTGAAFTGKFGSDDLTVASASGTFSDKNVANGKTVNISGITLSGTDAGNYVLTDSSATANADITPKALTITYSGVNKTYDATLAASVTTSDNRLGSDVLTIVRTAEFDNTGGTGKNAGDNKTINVTGVSLSGGDAINYSVAATSSTTANILKKDVTLTGVAVSDKVYDGLLNASFDNTGTLVDYISGDNVALNTGGMSAAFLTKGVGANKNVTLSGATLTGTDANNYNFTSPTEATASITARTLNVTYTGVNRVYDATTNATVTTGDDRVGGDVLSIVRAASFADKNVSDGKAVTVSGVSLSGVEAHNYAVAATGSTTANITKADISAVTGITAVNKVYDGNDTASLSTISAGFTGMFLDDVLSVASATGAFSGKTAADGKTVNITGISLGGGDAGNYNLTNDTATATANISKATISSVSGIIGTNKVYDGNTTATLDWASAVLAGYISGDTVSVNGATGTFDNKNVGAGKSVSIASITLTGSDASNYNFVAPSDLTTTANITAKDITAITGITAANKVYDQTTSATLTTNSAGFTGMVSGDLLAVASATGNFTDKNASDGKTVNITSLSLSGVDAGNYNLASSISTTTADITKKTLVLDLQGAGSKVYDGSTSINLGGITPVLTGIIAGDVVDVATGSVTGFVDKNVGANKDVLYSGFALSNTDASNYDIGTGAAASTASITRLNSVTWVGGATGDWFDPANWAGGAVPDLSNVANVVIPTGMIVSFNNTVVSPAETGTVSVDSIGMLGGLNVSTGTLNVANNLELANFTQSGGNVATGGNFTVTNSFAQSGGNIAATGNVGITQTAGNTTLGNITAGGTFAVSAANDIAQLTGSSLAIAGVSTLTSTSGNIELENAANNFIGAVNASGTNIVLNDANALTLGNIVASGTFGAVAVNDITQANGTSIAATGASTLTSTSGNIELESAVNNFVGAVNASSTNIALNDANALTLGNITTTGTFNVEANGDVTQTSGSALIVGTNANIGAGSGNVTITNVANTFGGSVGLSGANVTIGDDDSLQLGNINATGALAVTSTTGALTQAAGSSIVAMGESTLTAAADINLNSTTNNFVGAVNASGVNVNLFDGAGGITLGAITASGNLGVTSGAGAITKAGVIAATGTQTFIDIAADAAATVASEGPVTSAIASVQNQSNSGTLSPIGWQLTDSRLLAEQNPVKLLSNSGFSTPLTVAGFRVVELNLEEVNRKAGGTVNEDSANNAVTKLIKTAISDKTGGSPMLLVFDKGIKMPQEADDDLRKKANNR